MQKRIHCQVVSFGVTPVDVQANSSSGWRDGLGAGGRGSSLQHLWDDGESLDVTLRALSVEMGQDQGPRY